MIHPVTYSIILLIALFWQQPRPGTCVSGLSVCPYVRTYCTHVLFRECNISRTPWGNFLKNSTNVRFDSRMNWLHFVGRRLKVKASCCVFLLFLSCWRRLTEHDFPTYFCQLMRKKHPLTQRHCCCCCCCCWKVSERTLYPPWCLCIGVHSFKLATSSWLHLNLLLSHIWCPGKKFIKIQKKGKINTHSSLNLGALAECQQRV